MVISASHPLDLDTPGRSPPLIFFNFDVLVKMFNSLDSGIVYSPTSAMLPPINLDYDDHAMPFPDSNEDLTLIDTILDQLLAEVFPDPGSDRGLQEMLPHFKSNWRKTPLHLPLVLEPSATYDLGSQLADVIKCIIWQESFF